MLVTSIHFLRCSDSLSPSVTLNWPDSRSCKGHSQQQVSTRRAQVLQLRKVASAPTVGAGAAAGAG